MNKVIWKSIGEWSYFLSNVLVKIRVVFLPNYHLVLFLHTYRSLGVFQKKKKKSKQGSSLNNSIDDSKGLIGEGILPNPKG